MSKRTVMDALFDKADLRCTVCGAPMGTCDCWVECACGWSFRKGGKCRNPAHGGPKEPPEIMFFQGDDS